MVMISPIVRRLTSDEIMSMHICRYSDSLAMMRVSTSVGARRYSLPTARYEPESTRIIYISDMEESCVVSLCSRSRQTISKADTHVGCIVLLGKHCFTSSRMDSIRRRPRDSSSTENSVVIPVSSVTVRSVMGSWNKYEQQYSLDKKIPLRKKGDLLYFGDTSRI
jgi:hypothetical protein